jgi:iron(III)-salmochelin esterase
MNRRQLLGLGAALWSGCDREAARSGPEKPAEKPPPPPSSAWQELRYAASDAYPEDELVALRVKEKAPLVIALHGRGEAGRGLEAGARGWRDDYHLDRAIDRLAAPPLTDGDMLGFSTAERLAELNASLASHAFEGLAVACPYTPVVPDRTVLGAAPFGRFLCEKLVPQAAEKLGAPAARERTGIDGVSMGGRLALLVGLSHPEVFGAVGALQPAISTADADWIADLAVRARATAPFSLRLVSSEEDPFLEAVRALSAALEKRSFEHRVVVTPGPHDYAWNRGPGSYELLLWHERVLRGLPPP